MNNVTPMHSRDGGTKSHEKAKGKGKEKHDLIKAGETGDRLVILKASLTFTLDSLAKPDCPDYVKSNLLGKVQSLTAEIEKIEAERKRAAEEAHADDDDGEAEGWDEEAI